MKTLKFLSVLLLYPDEELLKNIGELKSFVKLNHLETIEPFFDYLENSKPLEIQEHYTSVFDLNPTLSLYILEHFQDDKNKGLKLLEFLEKYSKEGLSITKNHTADYLPMYLEYLSLIEKDKALSQINNYSDLFKSIYQKLVDLNSPYKYVFELLSKKEVLHGLP